MHHRDWENFTHIKASPPPTATAPANTHTHKHTHTHTQTHTHTHTHAHTHTRTQRSLSLHTHTKRFLTHPAIAPLNFWTSCERGPARSRGGHCPSWERCASGLVAPVLGMPPAFALHASVCVHMHACRVHAYMCMHTDSSVREHLRTIVPLPPPMQREASSRADTNRREIYMYIYISSCRETPIE